MTMSNAYRPQVMAPQQRQAVKLVYVRMIRAQVDSVEGKLSKNDVLILDEDKAMRWVYRAGIAVPATQDQYEAFQDQFRRTRNGSRRLRNQRLAVPRPENNPFTYVSEDDPEFETADQKLQPQAYAAPDAGASMDDSEDDEDEESWEVGPDGESRQSRSSLASQLDLAAEESEYPGEPVADYSDEDGRVLDEDEGQGGVYDQAIGTAPGDTVSPPVRGRRAARR